ncbi:MAG: hypothetical protein OEZ01_15335 [Candidatus Heimdallarchaeota archaeon]|nr:hypothetical protein [Candidatus Heimdallarchaeota archaeon]MDH5647382.1 hypothetical protein [Candidatus Heimdallarchaeota archaeon]
MNKFNIKENVNHGFLKFADGGSLNSKITDYDNENDNGAVDVFETIDRGIKGFHFSI